MGRTANSKDISPSKIGEIRGLLRLGNMSQRDIAERSQVSKTTVANIARKLTQGDVLTPQRRGKCGRKAIFSPSTLRILEKIVKKDRTATNNTITNALSESGVQTSTRTVRRRLADLGYHSRRPVRKPKLTDKMKQKRLAWAKKYQHFTEEDWKKVCFSDESTIQIMMNKAQFVRRKVEEKYHPECVLQTIKHPTSVMVWSVISSKGLGRVHVVEGTMRQQQYISVLETRLVPQLNDWFPNGEEHIFQQDGAPCHTAKSVKKWLNDKNIPLLDWPGNSPDLNPIENVWELLKRAVAKENVTTKRELIEKIIYHWNHNEDLRNKAVSCIESMPRRKQDSLYAPRHATKY